MSGLISHPISNHSNNKIARIFKLNATNQRGRQNRQQQVRRSNVEHGRVRHGGDDPTEPMVRQNVNECFVIERTTPMRNVMRNTRGEICELRFMPLEEADRPDLVLEALIQHLLDRVLAGHPRPLMVGLQLHPPGFDRPYIIRLRPPEQNNAAALAAAIERLNEQSAAGIDLLSGTTVTKVLAVWPLGSIRADPQRGGGCDLNDEHHVSHNVQSIVRVENPDDRLCLARAMLIGLRDRETRMPNGGGRDALRAYVGHQINMDLKRWLC
ncbi:hypothetical protein niasHT_030503 [Heterodera trifolii]|uniref:Uncharacterized protein n=1 Tax=Heterodera trifolii TaxID=157864 RepID=A0ABD2IV63_9BILA